jgi:hypothetical protein
LTGKTNGTAFGLHPDKDALAPDCRQCNRASEGPLAAMQAIAIFDNFPKCAGYINNCMLYERGADVWRFRRDQTTSGDFFGRKKKVTGSQARTARFLSSRRAAGDFQVQFQKVLPDITGI